MNIRVYKYEIKFLYETTELKYVVNKGVRLCVLMFIIQ